MAMASVKSRTANLYAEMWNFKAPLKVNKLKGYNNTPHHIKQTAKFCCSENTEQSNLISQTQTQEPMKSNYYKQVEDTKLKLQGLEIPCGPNIWQLIFLQSLN